MPRLLKLRARLRALPALRQALRARLRAQPTRARPAPARLQPLLQAALTRTRPPASRQPQLLVPPAPRPTRMLRAPRAARPAAVTRTLPAALPARTQLRAIRTRLALLTRTLTRLRDRSCHRPHHHFRSSDSWASAHWFPVSLLAARNSDQRSGNKELPGGKPPGSFFCAPIQPVTKAAAALRSESRPTPR